MSELTAEKYLSNIGFDDSHLPEMFNDDDKSYYKVTELMEGYFEARSQANDDNTGDSGLHLQRVMHRKSFLEERITYTENKLKQDRNSEEVESLEYDLYGFKQQLAAIEYVLYGA